MLLTTFWKMSLNNSSPKFQQAIFPQISMTVLRLQISVSLDNAKIQKEASSASVLKASSSLPLGGGVWVSIFCYTHSLLMKQVYSFSEQN